MSNPLNNDFMRNKLGKVRRTLGNKLAPGSFLNPAVPATLAAAAAEEEKADLWETPEFNARFYATELADKLEVNIQGMAGKGGFGKVYACVPTKRHNVSERLAVKIVASKFTTPATRKIWKRAALREAYYLNKLEHPNIVKYYDFTFLQDQVFRKKCYMALKMEYLDCTLEKVLVEKGALELEEVAFVGTHIGGAVAWMISKGYAHHDIKPLNMMFKGLDLKGHDFEQQLYDSTPKLTDFGLVQRYSKDRNLALDESFERHGTPFYMSTDKKLSDTYEPFKSDSFSLGMSLTQMLFGDFATFNKVVKKEEPKIEVLKEYIEDHPSCRFEAFGSHFDAIARGPSTSITC